MGLFISFLFCPSCIIANTEMYGITFVEKCYSAGHGGYRQEDPRVKSNLLASISKSRNAPAHSTPQ